MGSVKSVKTSCTLRVILMWLLENSHVWVYVIFPLDEADLDLSSSVKTVAVHFGRVVTCESSDLVFKLFTVIPGSVYSRVGLVQILRSSPLRVSSDGRSFIVRSALSAWSWHGSALCASLVAFHVDVPALPWAVCSPPDGPACDLLASAWQLGSQCRSLCHGVKVSSWCCLQAQRWKHRLHAVCCLQQEACAVLAPGVPL